MADYALIIGGKRVNTEQTFNVLNPADGAVVGACPQGTAALLDQAVGAGRQALPGWAALPDETRSAKLLEIADLIEKHQAELSALVTREQGKTQSGLGANMEVGGKYHNLEQAIRSANALEVGLGGSVWGDD